MTDRAESLRALWEREIIRATLDEVFFEFLAKPDAPDVRAKANALKQSDEFAEKVRKAIRGNKRAWQVGARIKVDLQ